MSESRNATKNGIVEEVKSNERCEWATLKGGYSVHFYYPGDGYTFPKAILSHEEDGDIFREDMAEDPEECIEQFVEACDGKAYGELDQMDVDDPESRGIIHELNMREGRENV